MARSGSRGPKRARQVLIALVDDHPLMLDGIERSIEQFEGYRVVVREKNAKDFIHALQATKRVDIALVDLRLPVMNGFQLLGWLSANRSEIRRVALTFSDDPIWHGRAIKSGACGVLTKTIEREDLRAALDEVMRTGRYRPPLPIASRLEMAEQEVLFKGEVAEKVMFLDKEIEFMKLISDPAVYTYEQIADLMHVSPHTVDSLFRTLRDMLDIHSRGALAVYAKDHGIA